MKVVSFSKGDVALKGVGSSKDDVFLKAAGVSNGVGSPKNS